ncbi:GumC family protein [Sphingomonas sp. GCM10030256]|uniref:GumC family protein n=1 Tax=Sphingomonas sp. GCM10030256 TaxID=3273427 RepID=UPI0036071D06
MNKADRALSAASDDRLIALLADRVSERVKADYEVVEEQDGIDLRAIWSALYRNRWLILAVIGLALAAGVASILLTTPTYRAATTVQIEQQSAKILGTEDLEPVPSAQEAERFLQTQVDIIKSRALADQVVDELRLAGKPDFLAAQGAKPLKTGKDGAKEKREQALALLEDSLTVTLPRNSRVVSIAVESRDPTLAASVANAYASNFISSNLQRRFDTSSYSREFLQKQLALTKAKLEESERSLIAYSRSAGLIDASAGASGSAAEVGPRSLTTANLVQLNQSFAQARSARLEKEQRWNQAQATPLMSLPEVLSNPTVQQLTQRRAEAEATYSEELKRRRAEHPTVVQAKANIGELDRQIATLANSIRNSIREQYQVALRQEQALAGNVSQLKGATLAEQDRGVRYNILKREVDTNRELYDGLLQRYKEVGAQAGVTNNNISIVDKAEAPSTPVRPRPAINMALAGLAGLALAFLLVFAREKFDDAVRAPDDVEAKLHLPLLGVVPLVNKGADVRAQLRDPRSSVAEAQQSVRSSIELASADGVPPTLLLTSSRPSEGKSTTAFALARDFAAAGQHVLLVDADLRKPSVHRILGLPNKAGLSNVLARQMGLEQVIQPTDQPGLMFLSSGPLPPSPAQLLATNLLGELFTTLQARFDVVIIDGPPVLGLADAPRLAAAAQGVLFVIEANGAHRGAAKSALARLRGGGARMIGAVLTKFDARKIGYGEYGYGYSYRYGSGETAQLGQG